MRDYECPYSRLTFREIERVEQELSGRVRFAYRHFPLVELHRHAFAAVPAVKAAALQARFWDVHVLLFRHKALAETTCELIPSGACTPGAWRGERATRDEPHCPHISVTVQISRASLGYLGLEIDRSEGRHGR